MADIFLSYKKENRGYAERFAVMLRGAGFSIWWDDEIVPREAWDATIEREISAAACVVVLWSPLAVQSDWVRKEAHYGHDHGRLVPVMVEACQLPLAFTLTQTVDLCGWAGEAGNRQWRKLLIWIADVKASAAGAGAAGGGATNAAPVRDRPAIGALRTGEPFVDGAYVNQATPAGTLFQDQPGAPVLRIVPRGDYVLGGDPGDPDCTSLEMPQKRIFISRPFALGVYPVTNAEYGQFLAAQTAPAPAAAAARRGIGGWFTRKPEAAQALPPAATLTEAAASQISFDEAAAFAAWLSRETGSSYRLPSETEWEYACRAGSTTRFTWGDQLDPSRALYRWPGAPHTAPAAPGRFGANAFGLYDMHGNVREWVLDSWHESYDLTPPDGRPVVEGHSSMRVTRGGGWSDPAPVLRSSARGRATQTIRSAVIGVRLMRLL